VCRCFWSGINKWAIKQAHVFLLSDLLLISYMMSLYWALPFPRTSEYSRFDLWSNTLEWFSLSLLFWKLKDR
jgi:hypothetical protein